MFIYNFSFSSRLVHISSSSESKFSIFSAENEVSSGAGNLVVNAANIFAALSVTTYETLSFILNSSNMSLRAACHTEETTHFAVAPN